MLLPKIAPMPPVARMIASAAKRAQLHRAQIQRGDAARHALRVEHGGEKLPALVLLHLAFGLVAAHLLVERVQQLLSRGGAGKGGAVVKRSAKAAEIEQPLRGAIERHAHAVQQIDNGRRGLAHRLHRRLVGKKVAAIDRVVKVLVGGVALALQILGRVDAALRAN